MHVQSRAVWRLAAILVFVMGLLAPTAPVRATPPDLFGFGARSSALGMTGVSYADDYEAVFANPAGLTRLRTRAFAIGLHAAAYQVAVDEERFPIEPSRGQSFGLRLPLPFGGVLEDRLALGIGLFTPMVSTLRAEVRFPEVPQFPVLARAQVVSIKVALGVDLAPLVEGLRFGVGVATLADLTGRVDVRLDETQSFSSRTETQLLTAPAPIVGLSYAGDAYGLGAVYRSELMSDMVLTVQVEDLVVEIPELELGGIVQYAPHTVALEAYVEPLRGLRFIGHASFRRWAAWPGSQIATTSASPLAPDPEFHDTLSPRLAVEATFGDQRATMALRLGYAFEPSPAPPARLAQLRTADGQPLEADGQRVWVPLRYLDNDRHVLTGGVELSAALGPQERLELDLYGQLHALAPRQHEVPESGGEEPMETDGLMLAAGWTLGVVW